MMHSIMYTITMLSLLQKTIKVVNRDNNDRGFKFANANFTIRTIALKVYTFNLQEALCFRVPQYHNTEFRNVGSTGDQKFQYTKIPDYQNTTVLEHWSIKGLYNKST